MDGFGLRKETEGNAIAAKSTPPLTGWRETRPPTSNRGLPGWMMGLPDGQMGNSEVGPHQYGRRGHRLPGADPLTKSIEEGEYLTQPRAGARHGKRQKSRGPRCI